MRLCIYQGHFCRVDHAFVAQKPKNKGFYDVPVEAGGTVRWTAHSLISEQRLE